MLDFFAQPEPPPPPTRKARPRASASASAAAVVDPSGGYTEAEVALLLGITQQTLRNMRVGYKSGGYSYPPRLTKGVEWYKLRETKRAPVRYSVDWVRGMEHLRELKAKCFE